MSSKDPDNLNIKLTDFGFSSFFDPKVGLKGYLGSPIYMAPEIVKEQKYGSKVDIWSIGVITYKLLTGQSPYGQVTADEREHIQKTKGIILSTEFKNNFS